MNFQCSLKHPPPPKEEEARKSLYNEVYKWLQNRGKPKVGDEDDEEENRSTDNSKRKATEEESMWITTPRKLKKYMEGDNSDTEVIETLNVASYESIRSSNILFFSYDPRGVYRTMSLPVNYCTQCRCPEPYCADIVIGREVHEELFFFLIFLNTYKSIEDASPRGIKILFTYYYKRAVHAKMRTNNIHFPMGFNLSKCFRIPTCVQNNSLKTLIDLVVDTTRIDEEESEYDLTEIELQRFATKYCKDDDDVHVYYNKPLN
jgi:hypothetical protein